MPVVVAAAAAAAAEGVGDVGGAVAMATWESCAVLAELVAMRQRASVWNGGRQKSSMQRRKQEAVVGEGSDGSGSGRLGQTRSAAMGWVVVAVVSAAAEIANRMRNYSTV